MKGLSYGLRDGGGRAGGRPRLAQSTRLLRFFVAERRMDGRTDGRTDGRPGSRRALGSSVSLSQKDGRTDGQKEGTEKESVIV